MFICLFVCLSHFIYLNRALQDGNKGTDFQVSKYSGMDSTYSLPDNVVLLTLQELDDGKVLLRLAHLYEVLDFSFTETLKGLFGKSESLSAEWLRCLNH